MHWARCLDVVLATVEGWFKLEARKSDVKQVSSTGSERSTSDVKQESNQTNHHSEKNVVLVPRIHSFWSIFLFATRAAHLLPQIRPHFLGGIRIN
jgi:hypothetical protein